MLQKGETIGYRWISPKGLVDFFDSGKCIESQRERLKEYIDLLR